MTAWFLLLFASTGAQAHLVGVQPWCLANSPVHFECYFDDHENCTRTAQKRTTALERWECVAFPVDFRNIPKSGEGTAAPTPPKPKAVPTSKFDL